MSRRNNFTVSQGLDARYWLTSAAYVAIGILILFGLAVMFLQNRGSPNATNMVSAALGSWVLVYSLLGVVTYPAIFKDASYHRSNRGYWNPKWWHYIGVGLGIPALVVLTAAALQSSTIGLAVAILVHGLTAGVANAWYLYRRHDIVGVP